MTFVAARIRDVRSVWGPPLEVPLGAQVTVLVGPNRAGSSNVAWAIAAALDDSIAFRPDRDLPRDHGRTADAQPVVELLRDRGPRSTVRWTREEGTRSADGGPRPPGRVVLCRIQQTPRDLLRDLFGGPEQLATDLPAHLVALEQAVLDTCHRVLPEVATVEVASDGTVVVRDDLGTALPVPEVRALVALGVARHLATVDAPPAAVLVESPEAFLHPAAQEVVAHLLVEVAGETGAPVLVTTSSPFAVPRLPEVRVVALARDASGRTEVVGSARGDETQARLLGGLLRDNGLAAVLDRVGEVAPDTRGVLIVEGGTDEAYLRLAAARLGRADELEHLVIRPSGGAMAAALAAVLLRAETDVPLLVLLDADEAGRRARTTLVSRFGFDRSSEVLTYADVFEGGPPGVEAETLFDVGLVRRFVRERGRSASRGERRLHTLDHVDLTSSGKSAFVGWLAVHADPEHLGRWGDLLDLLAARFDAGAR